MGKEYPINVRLLGVRMSSLEQKLPENKNQKQLNDFWKVKKDKVMKNEDDVNNVESVKNERKRKRNWNQMNGEEDNEINETKRRKLDSSTYTNEAIDVDMKDKNANKVSVVDKKIQLKKKLNDKVTISKLFEKQKEKIEK